MSLFKKNSLAVLLLGAAAFSAVALQGCSSDEQNTPASGGSGGASHAGSGGKANSTAGTAGKPVSGGGAAGEEPTTGDAGMGGETSMGGEGGAGPVSCSTGLSFDNTTLTALTDNDGKLPELP
jgi:hypothetical protein